MGGFPAESSILITYWGCCPKISTRVLGVEGSDIIE